LRALTQTLNAGCNGSSGEGVHPTAFSGMLDFEADSLKLPRASVSGNPGRKPAGGTEFLNTPVNRCPLS
jgi:hypothetical protein